MLQVTSLFCLFVCFWGNRIYSNVFAFGGKLRNVMRRKVPGCLFRSQCGVCGFRGWARQEIWKSHFSAFTVGSLDQFPEYIAWKRQLGVWGDDPEIQAMSELYNRPILVYAFHPVEGAVVLNRMAYHATDLRPPIRYGCSCMAPGKAHRCELDLFSRYHSH